jgi:hydrogenase/urease accessory protein HupE
MSIGRRLPCVLACVLALGVSAARPTGAHPVSQGALEIDIVPHGVRVTAKVSMEEVLVAAAYGEQKTLSALEAVRRHGPYLLAHLRVAADGRRLEGSVMGVPDHAAGPPAYRLEYRMDGAAPARVTVEEDVLREFEFAPGNPWEASYVVRVSRDGRPAMDGLLLTSRAPLVLDLASMKAPGSSARIDAARMAGEYFRHGVVHILSGYDHLLFIIALVLAVTTVWDLVAVITAFTLAHSITLTLSVLNVVRLPSTIVEPMIAASIVFVALQNIILPEKSRGTGRLVVAFFFGLFHGLGFAGGLLSAMEGLAGWAVGLAIVAFSVGVETGHQMVVLPILGTLTALRRVVPGTPQMPAHVLRYGSAGIFVAGVWYLVAALR